MAFVSLCLCVFLCLSVCSVLPLAASRTHQRCLRPFLLWSFALPWHSQLSIDPASCCLSCPPQLMLLPLLCDCPSMLGSSRSSNERHCFPSQRPCPDDMPPRLPGQLWAPDQLLLASWEAFCDWLRSADSPTAPPYLRTAACCLCAYFFQTWPRFCRADPISDLLFLHVHEMS